MNDAGLRLAVWAQGEVAPRPATTLAPAEGDLPLDRELFAVQDSSISRAANAPRLVVKDGAVTLVGNTRSVRQPLVVAGATFLTFQEGLAAHDALHPCRVRPADLSEPGRLVTSPRGAVALFRTLAPSGAPSHHLRTLPPVVPLAPGASMLLVPPVTVILGDGALELQGDETDVPPPPPVDMLVPKVVALELERLLARLELPEGLGALPGDSPALVQLPLTLEPESLEAARHSAARLLHARGERIAFVPVIVDERLPRLALVYLEAPSPDPDQPAGLIVSGPDPETLLQSLADLLTHRRSRPPSASGPPAAPVDLEPRAPLACFGDLETSNLAFARQVDQLASMAASDVSIVFLGESGTGKEFAAREVHRHSPRRAGPFVAVNCAGMPRDLVGSELFGHVPGAFTGASQPRQGAFAAAEGGTLLLDEIGDAPLAVQLSLLRALETRKIRPVGSDRERPVNVRVLAATSRNLTEMIAKGEFREDLYYRLAELVVTLPALRERPEDLPALARAVLHSEAPGASFTDAALRAVCRLPLRGNVRELRNLVRRGLAVVGKEGKLDAAAMGLDGGPEYGGATVMTSRVMVVGDGGLPARANVARTGTAGTAGRERKETALETVPGVETRLVFPKAVTALGAEMWKAGMVLDPDAEGRQEVRAQTRAALIYLRAQYPMDVWPRALAGQYQRLFGPRWATAEGGRGLREVVRALGYDGKNEEVKGWVVEVVG